MSSAACTNTCFSHFITCDPAKNEALPFYVRKKKYIAEQRERKMIANKKRKTSFVMENILRAKQNIYCFKIFVYYQHYFARKIACMLSKMLKYKLKKSDRHGEMF